jgi:hypothetical protein
VHHGGRVDRHPDRHAARLPAHPADLLGGNRRRARRRGRPGGADVGADRAARCDPDGAFRGRAPPAVLEDPGPGRGVAGRPGLARSRRPEPVTGPQIHSRA